jgi:hypothetical protein
MSVEKFEFLPADVRPTAQRPPPGTAAMDASPLSKFRKLGLATRDHTPCTPWRIRGA